MKRLIFLSVGLLILLLLSQIGFAQTTKTSLPQVPITYAGDTAETIKRRAEWIKGAKKEAELNWWGILPPGQGKLIGDEFSKVYPFIKVVYWSQTGEEIANKTEAEFSVGRYNVDLLLGGEPSNYPRWRKMGIIEKFTDLIPGIEKLDREAYSKYGDSIIPGNQLIIPNYNTKLVTGADAPKSWEDLLDPKWRGQQIAISPDTKAWVTLALANGGWGIEKTENYLRKLKEQKLIFAKTHSSGISLLSTGEFKILGEGYSSLLFAFKDKKAPVEWCPVDLIVVSGPSFSMQSKAPHPNAVRLFLEWVSSSQALQLYEKITYYGAYYSASGSKLSKLLAGRKLAHRTEEVVLKEIELKLGNRFGDILGFTK